MKSKKKETIEVNSSELIEEKPIEEASKEEANVAIEETPKEGEVKVEAPKGMKAFDFFLKYWFLLVALFIAVGLLLSSGYLLSPFQKNNMTVPLIIDIIVLVISTIGSIVLCTFIRLKMKSNNVAFKDFMFATIFFDLFLCGFILTIVFRLIALYYPNHFVNIGGLTSLFVSVGCALVVLATALIPFKNFKY